MADKLDLIIDKIDTLADDVKDLRKHVVDGNGEPGLIVRVAVLEEKDRQGSLTRKQLWAIGAGVVGAIGWVISVVVPKLLALL